MIPRLRCIAPLVFAASFAGCKTNAPMVRNHDWSLQTKLQAVQHWRAFAAKLAGGLQADGQFSGRTVHIETSGEGTEFSAAFAELLSAELLDRGMGVTQAADQADFQLVVAHQVLIHGRRFGLAWNATTPIGGVLLGTRNFFTGDGSGDPGQTRGELLTTARIARRSKLLYCRSQIAYINTKDASLYLSPEDFDNFAKTERERGGLFQWISEACSDGSRW